jgi:hypothetical protein
VLALEQITTSMEGALAGMLQVQQQVEALVRAVARPADVERSSMPYYQRA